MTNKDKATRAASDLGGIMWDLTMAANYDDAAYIDRARKSLQRALAALSDAPEPGTLSPINGE